MPRKINLIGKQFGRLTVIKEVNKIGMHIYWECKCDCRNICVVQGGHLRNSKTKSCGCLRNEKTRERFIKHGMSGTTTYEIWEGMLQRCNNPNSTNYHYYGERGIKVCDRWKLFKNFFADMGTRPKCLTLERKNNELGYSKDNCCWDTWYKQNQNHRLQNRNKTGFTGISWCNTLKKYTVKIRANHIRYHIGNFTTLEQAILARKKAEQKYWGQQNEDTQ